MKKKIVCAVVMILAIPSILLARSITSSITLQPPFSDAKTVNILRHGGNSFLTFDQDTGKMWGAATGDIFRDESSDFPDAEAVHLVIETNQIKHEGGALVATLNMSLPLDYFFVSPGTNFSKRFHIRSASEFHAVATEHNPSERVLPNGTITYQHTFKGIPAGIYSLRIDLGLQGQEGEVVVIGGGNSSDPNRGVKINRIKLESTGDKMPIAPKLPSFTK